MGALVVFPIIAAGLSAIWKFRALWTPTDRRPSAHTAITFVSQPSSFPLQCSPLSRTLEQKPESGRTRQRGSFLFGLARPPGAHRRFFLISSRRRIRSPGARHFEGADAV